MFQALRFRAYTFQDNGNSGRYVDFDFITADYIPSYQNRKVEIDLCKETNKRTIQPFIPLIFFCHEGLTYQVLVIESKNTYSIPAVPEHSSGFQTAIDPFI